MPERIQLRRTRGWRKPEGAIVVARPTKWGNPWRVGDAVGVDLDAERYRHVAATITPEVAVALYRSALIHVPNERVIVGLWVTVDDAIRELAGHDLACWCPLGQPCHADVLLALANPTPL